MARFLDQPEPVLALVGMVLPDESSDGDLRVLFNEHQVVDAPRELAEFLRYVTVPRRMGELVSWVQDAGGSESDIRELVLWGSLLQAGPGSAEDVLAAFRGLRLVPMGFPVDLPGASGDVVYIGPDERSTQVLPVSPLLGAAMWEQQAFEDLPSTTARLAADTGLSHEEASRLVLIDLDALLANRLARLEVIGRRDLRYYLYKLHELS